MKDFKENKKDKNCTPDILEAEDKYHSADFSCHDCSQTDCYYWVLYHPDENLSY